MLLMQCTQGNQIPIYVGNELYCINSKILPNVMQIRTTLLYKTPTSTFNSRKSASETSALDLRHCPSKCAWPSCSKWFLICKILSSDMLTCLSVQIVKNWHVSSL